MSGRGSVVFTLVLGILFWGTAVSLSPQAQAKEDHAQELLYYPSGKFLREAVLGYGQAAASLAWLRTIQYYGEHKRGDRVFDLMYHLCDVITDLDPAFEEPYVWGSFVLLTDAGMPDKGVALLAKARERNPDSWRLFFESGFSEYVFFRDSGEASGYFQRAAALPGAPEYVSRFAAYVTAHSGDLETSLYLWQEVALRTDNPKRRAWAEQKVAEIQAKIEAARAAEKL